MDDPYDVLGVRRGDADETIRAAYRKLAKKHHPDLNPGKPDAAERFKTINAAYELLSDPIKRGKFDRGEIDAAGNEIPPKGPTWHDFGDAAAGEGAHRYRGGPTLSPEDLESLFGAAFRDRFETRDANRRGHDAHYGLTVDFMDAARGAVRRLNLPDGRTLDVTIPAGMRDGHVLRLKGQGEPGQGSGPAGDALIEISVAPHKLFRRVGDEVVIDLPITLQEAVLGASIEVPTIKGKVRLKIPPNSSTGRRMRLTGQGIAGGNQVVVLNVELPHQHEPELEAFLKTWKPAHSYNPRAEMEAP
jgi:DnaJ-class molecular chaperone